MAKAKYFFDTEFIEDGKTIDLLSIGLVCEDGRTLYLQNLDCEFSKASDWVWRNVYPHLAHFDMRGKRACSPAVVESYKVRDFQPCSSSDCPWSKHFGIRDSVREFCDPEKYGKPEFWGYFCDYDWVAFCQLFGTMMELPKWFPMYCRDIKQWADQLGDVRIPKSDDSIHNALQDALWVKSAYEFLSNQPKMT